MNGGNRARLRNYCAILEIPLSSTDPNPELALNVLARMYLVPTIKSKAVRNRTLNEIRGNLSGHFDNYSVFVGATARVAVQMQEFPDWFNHLNASTEDLIARYKSLSTGIFMLKSLGIGATGGAVAAGLAQGSKEGSVRAGAKRFGQRLAGQGPLLEEAQRRLGTRMSPGRAGVVGAVVVIGGTLAYHSALEQQKAIRDIIMSRYQNGEVGQDQFRDVFGNEIDPSNIKRYWEL
ncbi:MAG: hypothetical protein ACK5MQ_07730 [Pikeienuella sp.]